MVIASLALESCGYLQSQKGGDQMDLRQFFGTISAGLSPAYIRATRHPVTERKVMAKTVAHRRMRNKMARRSRRINRKREQGLC